MRTKDSHTTPARHSHWLLRLVRSALCRVGCHDDIVDIGGNESTVAGVCADCGCNLYRGRHWHTSIWREDKYHEYSHLTKSNGKGKHE